MAYALQAGIHVSIDKVTWFKLTDHNRQEISINPTVIEKENRMANGTLRKFIVAKKDIISTSWNFLPSSDRPNTFDIISATASQSSITFTTSSAHNLNTNSYVNVTGINNLFNVVNLKVSAVSNNTFTVQKNSDQPSTISIVPPATRIGVVIDLTRPSVSTVDENKGASWITAFYNANVGNPIYIKIIASRHEDPSIGTPPDDSTYLTASDLTEIKEYEVFITGFTKSISKRTRSTDYVDMTIEFTEI